MIRVNLLPVQKRAKVTNVEKEFILFVLVVVLFGLGLSLAQGWVTSRVHSLESENKKLLEDKKVLEDKLKKYHMMEAALAEVSARLVAIKSIRDQQSLPVRYIDEVVSRIPDEKMWFESLQMDRTAKISLSGVALDNQVFAHYVEQLRGAPLIRGVTIGQTSRKGIQGLDLVAFQTQVSAGTINPEKQP